MPSRIFMNLGNNTQFRTNSIRSLNSQINTGLQVQSVRLNLLAPMINRVATAKASCGSCGK